MGFAYFRLPSGIAVNLMVLAVVVMTYALLLAARTPAKAPAVENGSQPLTTGPANDKMAVTP